MPSGLELPSLLVEPSLPPPSTLVVLVPPQLAAMTPAKNIPATKEERVFAMQTSEESVLTNPVPSSAAKVSKSKTRRDALCRASHANRTASASGTT